MWISAYPLVEIDDFSRFHTSCGHEIESKEAHSISTWKSGFFGPLKLMSFLGRGKNNFLFNFEYYDLANGKE
jgi:hypothetical protein